MSIKCELCGRSFERIAYLHLKNYHNTTFEEYYRLFPNAPLTTPELRRSVSDSLCKHYDDPAVLAELSTLVRDAYDTHLEYHKAVSEASLRMWTDPEHHQKMSEKHLEWWAIPGNREKVQKAWTQFYIDNPSHGQYLSETQKQAWDRLTDDERFSRIQAMFQSRNHSQTFPEHLVEVYLDTVRPGEWLYNGQSQASIHVGGRVPDFVHKTSKWVILVHGSYWHILDQELSDIEYYKVRDWRCVVIWEFDTAVDVELDNMLKRVEEK
jgi:G:T-mismatch repair DNA endonuclease (very short patch repair protein)